MLLRSLKINTHINRWQLEMPSFGGWTLEWILGALVELIIFYYFPKLALFFRIWDPLTPPASLVMWSWTKHYLLLTGQNLSVTSRQPQAAQRHFSWFCPMHSRSLSVSSTDVLFFWGFIVVSKWDNYAFNACLPYWTTESMRRSVLLWAQQRVREDQCIPPSPSLRHPSNARSCRSLWRRI